MDMGKYAFASGVLLLAAACSTSAAVEPAATAPSTASPDVIVGPGPITIPNQGAALEGHTPTAFPGMGTGLFAGDNLNPGFPEGVGVQTYLTFAFPVDAAVGRTRLVSDALHISGTPFEDLGALVVEPVTYSAFGPALFDLVATGPATACTRTSETAIECDVTDVVDAAIAEGGDMAQFQIRFEQPADGDGRQDLALFFRSDSNTNEAGIFHLVISQVP